MSYEVSFLSIGDRARVRLIYRLSDYTRHLFVCALPEGRRARLARWLVDVLATEGLRRRYRADRLRRGVDEASVDPAFKR